MFQASANSGEANDTVTVEFYVNGALQGSDSTSPYSVNLSGLAAGSYTLMARAIDGQSAQTDSVTRTVIVSDTNNPPTVSITAPSGGANYPSAPAGFTITASATAGEVNGSIARVEFYVNGALVNTDTAGPWSYAVSDLANGSYVLTAKAVDQLNAETVSAPVTVTVGPQPKLYFVHVDHLNTPRLVANDQGQAVWRWDQQEAFGNNPPDENPSGLGTFEFPLRLPGQYFDMETNLHYNYFRDYDPSLGIYEESDPIGLLAGPNTYTYVRSNPLRSTDPLGLIVGAAAAGGGGALTGGAAAGTVGVVGGRRPPANDLLGGIEGAPVVPGDPLFGTRGETRVPTCPATGPDCERILDENLKKCARWFPGVVMLPLKIGCIILANSAYRRCKNPDRMSDGGDPPDLDF